MTLFVLDDILANPDEYVQDVLKNPFVDVEDGDNVFKGIQPRANDEVEKFVLLLFPDYTVKYNFIRQSPFKQIEPNYIHTDEMMGDKTVLVYLNKYYPPNAGTVLYDKDEDKSVRIYMKYNRLVVFDSREKHSRNLYNNFGEKNNSRLVQVLFLKK
jgi:hypothetical protein|tara:strand:- start:10 stop:477 length:468 start_codon:yes stop_codon:yes gene_type:complete